MFKIPKLKSENIPLIYFIAFLILVVATFLPAVRLGDPRIHTVSYYIGYHFTHVTLIFYLIGVILIFFRRPIASFVLTAIGNFILSGTIIYLLYEVGTRTKGQAYTFLYGFYIIAFLWIVLISINILMFKYKADLGAKPPPVQPVNNI